MSDFAALLDLTRGLFRAPSFAIFTDLLTGWVCAPGRRTITNMIAVVDPAGRRAVPESRTAADSRLVNNNFISANPPSAPLLLADRLCVRADTRQSR
ncbi:MAG: hypothetical protein U0990_03110 [Candidatus Nanopelagicales bacterium]|nr:hypothetical protein [Candidatus Nanopelagicales bacterium]MDZ4249061.1 hypothetical protein [Candidatus Nanopelagicales bacterium]MDZ7577638.1 hypothetical protein [Candidatus Nanopelagicales bacterium]